MSDNQKRFVVELRDYRSFSMSEENCNLLHLQEKLKNISDNKSFQIFWNDSIIGDTEGECDHSCRIS